MSNYTTHEEAISRKKCISDIHYDVTLALDNETSFFGQVTVGFKIIDYKNVDFSQIFLNFTNQTIWMNEDAVLFVNDDLNLNLVNSKDMVQQNRIAFEPIKEEIDLLLDQDQKDVSIKVQF
jgi:hypothetical protein